MPHTPTTPAPTPARLLRINEVAAEIGLTTRTIRYYEEVGLLAPAARSDGDYRLYDASDLDRLRFIRDLRDDAGFSLAQIRQLLEDEAARERNRARLRATTDPVERRQYLHEAEERILYPHLLKRAASGDAEDEAKEETDDAIRDHNKIRDGITAAAHTIVKPAAALATTILSPACTVPCLRR